MQEENNETLNLTPEQETLKTWNELAQLYYEKFMDKTMYNQSYDAFLQRLAKTVEKLNILDIGSGPGIVGKYLSESSDGVRLSLTCIDSAPNMVALGKRSFPEWEWIEMDSREISERFEHRKFHGIVVGFCIPYLKFEEIRSLVISVRSLLHENGILYLSFVPGDPGNSGFKSNNSGQRVYFNYHDEDNIINLVTVNGFSNLEIFHVEFPRPENQKEIHTVIVAQRGES